MEENTNSNANLPSRSISTGPNNHPSGFPQKLLWTLEAAKIDLPQHYDFTTNTHGNVIFVVRSLCYLMQKIELLEEKIKILEIKHENSDLPLDIENLDKRLIKLECQPGGAEFMEALREEIKNGAILTE